MASTHAPGSLLATRTIDVDPALLSVIKSAGAPLRSPKPPKTPESLPGLDDGLLAPLVALFKNYYYGVKYLQDQRGKYGDIYRVPFANLPMVAIWNADVLHAIMKNEDNAWSTALAWDTLFFGGLDRNASNMGSLLSFDFDEHKTARKLVQPGFHLKAIEGYLQTAEGHFAKVIPQWIARGGVSFKKDVRSLFATVANGIFTGFHEPQAIKLVDDALVEFWSGMLAASHSWISPTWRRAQRGLQTLIKTFIALVPERRKNPGTDLFSNLCMVEDRGSLSDEAMVRIFITIMFGAFDTTSAAMTSMAYLLAKHPVWQDRLRTEAKKIDKTPDVAAMRNMKEHEWVWKETLRLMPVVAFMPRRTLREVNVGGHVLAPGTFVAPMTGAIGRHPRWWKSPDTFDPERFSPDRAEDKQHSGIFNPFGAGAHVCVGMQLASMEMKLFWHRMLTSCSFKLTRDYEARHTQTPMGMVSGNVHLTLDPIAERPLLPLGPFGSVHSVEGRQAVALRSDCGRS